MSPPVIHLQGISRAYREGGREQRVLDSVSLRVEEGETAALLGRSGSGKSTLLNLVAGIDRPDAGRVEVDGQELTAMNETRRTLFRRRHIGFIYQFFNLLPSLTAAENIRFVLELNGHGRDEARRRGETLLRRLGLAGQAERFPSQLSGGEQQRVAMARAVAHRPRLVLADEPTGNLDARTGGEVLSLLHELLEENGGALLLVTHSPAVARDAGRVLTLEDGLLREREADLG